MAASLYQVKQPARERAGEDADIMRPFLPLLLLFLLLSAQALTSDCPANCSCPDLASIFCHHRRSPTVPQGVPATTKNLYLFQNGISTLSRDDFSGLDALEMLDLSQNQLSELPDQTFELLPSLLNLDLSSNLIISVSRESFSGLGLLQRLYLHGNRIQSIHPEAFEGLDHLLELKLQGNQLTALPHLQLPRLLLLDVSHNNLQPPPGPADLQTPNLESLKLAGLGLVDLDGGLLQSLSNLHDLDISRNELQHIPAALGEARGLIKLSLALNPLGELRPEDLQNLRGLQELDLSSLKLQSLPEDLRWLFPRLRVLTAAENPFNCLCPLVWLPTWLKEGRVELGRPEETRCHFPPINAGKVLARLEHGDFGCPPTTTTVATVVVAAAGASTPGSTTPPRPLLPTTPPGTTEPPKPPPPPPPPRSSDRPSPVETDSELPPPPPPPPPPASPSSGRGAPPDPLICPSNICLNGGTCVLDVLGTLTCSCARGTSGTYCENRDELPPPPPPPKPQPRPRPPPPPLAPAPTPPIASVPDVGSRQVTSTSILLDLQRFIETRPYLKGIRLTYRNLSGPDRRPMELSVPASYPEYTLRGLRPNSTYSICAGPLGEPGVGRGGDRSCTEARTALQLPETSADRAHPDTWSPDGTAHPAPEPRVKDGQLVTALVPALAAVLTAAAAAVIVGTVCYLRRRKQAKAQPDLCGEEASPLELEGVKARLDNGDLPQKQPETSSPPPASAQNGHHEYEVPIMQTHCTANNNLASLKPSYF
ncbi:hypothetical protein JZ751_019728 [Albula glossodonta]|uniref:Vasorin n=1 Tax=Albula glossodonta TaxID=121402 RepID=A0A8T2MYT5_9TELE|nr:hypothetical protein JZ751_019728 [Albula glossodonta]